MLNEDVDCFRGWLLQSACSCFGPACCLPPIAPPRLCLSRLNAGESYVINNVSPGEVPAVKVITNPHALVVHNEEPGKVVLLGAEAGEWTISVKTADGGTSQL